jgi:bifunctional non-homologous end joining protein LigD
MLAALSEPPICQRGWIYEPKYDGIRALADVRPPAGRAGRAAVALYSRNGREKHQQFPEIAQALATLARALPGPVLLDGEIVAVDARGRPLGFQDLQGRINLGSGVAAAEREQPAALILFDLLRDGDEDLRGQPLAARRLRLQERVRIPRSLQPWIRLSDVAPDDGRALLQRARTEGWEGLIAKDGQSVYHSGRRTPAWRKLKLLLQQEFVVGGWTEPRQTRAHFGALLVGYYDPTGALRWAGGVGTGFDQRELDRLARLLVERSTERSPFADRVRTAERPHWVRPELVAEVRFTEWTDEGLLRQPVYLGLRTDKPAREVRRESVPAAPANSGSPGRVAVPASGRRPSRGAPDAPAGPDSPSMTALVERLAALEEARQDGELALPEGDSLRVTNLSKVFWPALGITKGELLRYYVRVAPLILPAVDDRPMVMKRFPNGIGKPAFYQQRHREAVPRGVRRAVLPPDVEPIEEEGPRDRLIGGSLATLLYMTQLAAISQDPWFSRVSDPLHADYVALDLDPGEGVGFDRVLDVARLVHDALERYDIPGVPKTSGASGLHIYIPLPAGTTYETGQLLCRMIATIVATEHPQLATVERTVNARRRGTVYVDFLQNILGKTLATAYSARASDYAGVSTPLTWQEVHEGIDPRAFTVRTAPARFAEVGDLWRPVLTGPAVDLAAVIARGSEPLSGPHGRAGPRHGRRETPAAPAQRPTPASQAARRGPAAARPSRTGPRARPRKPR